jgi:hypothetical protein
MGRPLEQISGISWQLFSKAQGEAKQLPAFSSFRLRIGQHNVCIFCIAALLMQTIVHSQHLPIFVSESATQRRQKDKEKEADQWLLHHIHAQSTLA